MTVLLGNDVVTDSNFVNLINPNQVRYRTFTAVASGDADEAVFSVSDVGDDITAVLADSAGNVLSYGRVVSTVSGDNTVSLSPVVSLVSGTDYKLGLFGSGFASVNYESGLSETWRQTTSGTYPTVPDPLNNLNSATVNGGVRAFVQSTTASLTIVSTDATMQRNTDFEVVCSTPATAPTTGNTTLTNGSDTLTPSSVTGSDPYTLTFPVGDLTKQVDATGYDWTLTVGAETATTGNIPLVIQSGYTKVDLTSPVTTNGSLLFGYSGDVPVTGDDLEYDVTSTLDSGVSFSVATDGVWTVTEASPGDWVTDITVDRRVVQADGTIGTTDTLTLSASTGSGGIVTAVVSPMVSNMISNMVN